MNTAYISRTDIRLLKASAALRTSDIAEISNLPYATVESWLKKRNGVSKIPPEQAAKFIDWCDTVRNAASERAHKMMRDFDAKELTHIRTKEGVPILMILCYVDDELLTANFRPIPEITNARMHLLYETKLYETLHEITKGIEVVVVSVTVLYKQYSKWLGNRKDSHILRYKWAQEQGLRHEFHVNKR